MKGDEEEKTPDPLKQLITKKEPPPTFLGSDPPKGIYCKIIYYL